MSISTRAYTPVHLDVTAFAGCPASLEGELSLAAWVFAPPTLPGYPRVLVCLPGGSYTKAYYHLEVPGYPSDAYSFALALARQGFIVVALDHLGVGESTVPADGRQLSLSVMAAANAAATEIIRTRLREGALIAGLPALPEPLVLGVGHSMGAFLALAQQAVHRSFSGLALLGYTNGEMSMAGMERRLAESQGLAAGTFLEIMALMFEASASGYITTDRAIAHALFHHRVPAAVIAADDALATTAPGGILADVTRPGAMLALASQVDVPLFLANGAEVDISEDFRAEAAGYLRATDISLYLVEDSAHCQNFSRHRRALWNRLAYWANGVDQAALQG